MKKRYNAIVLKKFSRFDCKESSSLVKMSNQAISVHGLFIIITKFRHILCRGGRSASAGSSRTYSLQKAKSAFAHGRNMYAGGCYPPAWQMTGSQ